MLSRNQNSHFSKNPHVEIERSRFDRSSSVKLSFNVGELIPFFVDEVLPGDTFEVDTSKLIRMQTLVAPIMDNIYLDTYYFFVPNRLVWNHWQEFCGENRDAPWTQTKQYTVPHLYAPGNPSNALLPQRNGWATGTIADYMGIPVDCSGLSVNALPFRAYALIWNEWFRDQNLSYPQHVSVGNSIGSVDETNSGANWYPDVDAGIPPGHSSLEAAERGGYPLKVSKFRDYFTSCLPSPQKGPDVFLPFQIAGLAPVVSTGDDHSSAVLANLFAKPLHWVQSSHTDGVTNDYFSEVLVGPQDSSSSERKPATTFGSKGSNENHVDVSHGLIPSNLWADLNLADQSYVSTINELRLAFQMQRIYEKDARGGTRYIEILSNHFGVTSPDERLQRPEYLGGNRMLINVNQVIQQSESGTTPQGNVAAYSLTVDNHSDFTHSFVEHGFLIGVLCARYDHTYQQGLERFWSRYGRFDYYWPSLAHIGEQPVYNREIYNAKNGSDVDDEVFGYQEAWADYRYKPNRVCAEMRSNVTSTHGSLDVWNLADNYSELPKLSHGWIEEDGKILDRSLQVTSEVSHQLFGDIYINMTCTRPMPLFSVPGLMDHY